MVLGEFLSSKGVVFVLTRSRQSSTFAQLLESHAHFLSSTFPRGCLLITPTPRRVSMLEVSLKVERTMKWSGIERIEERDQTRACQETVNSRRKMGQGAEVVAMMLA